MFVRDARWNLGAAWLVSPHRIAVVTFSVMLSATSLGAEDLSRYRDFELGSSLSSVIKSSGVRIADVKVIHRRPAMVQEVAWRPPYGLGSTRVAADPVREVVFSFYNDQLFRIVIDYDRNRTEGMTNEDVVQALSATYGPPVRQKPVRPSLTSFPGRLEEGTVVAQWEDSVHRLTLRRGTYPVVFQIVAVSLALDDLAQAAIAQAVGLDEREAPQRDADQRKKQIADAIAAQEKARIVNKAAFRP